MSVCVHEKISDLFMVGVSKKTTIYIKNISSISGVIWSLTVKNEKYIYDTKFVKAQNLYRTS